jgi:hypothetical protein
MRIMETQTYRDVLIERAAVAFSHDKLDEATYEAFVARVQAARGEAELKVIESSLGGLLPVVSAGPAGWTMEDAREFSLNMGNLRKRGDWVDARLYRLVGKMSNFELDTEITRMSRNFHDSGTWTSPCPI